MSDAIPGLPAVAEPLFQKLRAEPLESMQALRSAVIEYVRTFDPTRTRGTVVDPIQAMQISQACVALIDRVGDEAPEHAHRLVQAACRYFVIADDGARDTMPSGLDDDQAVVNAVARHLGHGDLAVEVRPNGE